MVRSRCRDTADRRVHRELLRPSGRADGCVDVPLRLQPRVTGIRRRLRGLSARPRGFLRVDFRLPLPPPLESQSALFLSGVNRSDDLFIFFKGSIGGLSPGARYGVTVSVDIATTTPAGCVGVGGAPGESVWIKAGATAVEPLPVREGSYLRMNVDIGNQSNGGAQAVVLGNIANSRNCEQPRQWERKSFQDRSTPMPLSVPSDGRAWLLFGVDSGFESRTEIYFTRAAVTFTPAMMNDSDGRISDSRSIQGLLPCKMRAYSGCEKTKPESGCCTYP